MILLWLGCAGPGDLLPKGDDPDDLERIEANRYLFSLPTVTMAPLGNAPDASEADFLWQEGTIHDLSLEITPAAMSALESDPDDEQVATLGHGKGHWDVGVRLKGNMTMRGFAGKPSLKLDAHAVHPNQSFYGLRRITLNNMIQDDSMLREHVAYATERAMGLPAPRHGYVRLTINGEPYGLYGLVETMDEQFIEHNWPDDEDGNLYEGGYGADLYDFREDMFAVQESGDPTPPSDLQALIDELLAADDGYGAILDNHFDLDQLLDTLAFDLLSGSWDGYARAANNFLLYHAPEADRWHLVPWGQDQAFTDLYVPVEAGWEGRLLVLCGRDPACAAKLDQRVAAVLDGWSQLDIVGYATDVAATIAADCEADPRAEIPCDTEEVISFLQERPGVVRGGR